MRNLNPIYLDESFKGAMIGGMIIPAAIFSPIKSLAHEAPMAIKPAITNVTKSAVAKASNGSKYLMRIVEKRFSTGQATPLLEKTESFIASHLNLKKMDVDRLRHHALMGNEEAVNTWLKFLTKGH